MMSPRPEVEPLSEARWARIEESLMERLDVELPLASLARREAPSLRVPTPLRARRWAPIALVATFAVSAAAAVALHASWPTMRPSTSRVVTEASASHVTVGETSIDVSPESGFEVKEEDHATVLTLERGEVALHVAPREKDRPFLIEAGDVHVRVVGTELTVKRAGIGATVAVRHGVVEVREHGDLAVLHAGERWPADLSAGASATPPLASPQTSAPTQPLGGAQSPAQSPGVSSASSTFPQASAPSPAEPRVAAELPSPPPAHVAPSFRTPSRARPPAPAVAPVAAAALAAPAPAVAASPNPAQDVAPAAAPEPSAQSKYESAARLEQSDPARALRIYTDLSQGSDAWAQNALYAAGRLQADRGARTDAAKRLEEYLRRFPGGTNAQDARALRESLR